MTSDEVAARLAIVSALRALGFRLPHISTPTEIQRLKRFDALVHAPERATDGDVDALVTGWSRWWGEGRRAELADMARQIDATLIDSDRRLATFATAAGGGQAPPMPVASTSTVTAKPRLRTPTAR